MRKIEPNQDFVNAKMGLLSAGVIALVVFTIKFFHQEDFTLIEYVYDISEDIMFISGMLFMLYWFLWVVIILPERVGPRKDGGPEAPLKQSSRRGSLLYKDQDDLQYELVVHNNSAVKTFEDKDGKLNLLFGSDGGKFGTYEPHCSFDIEVSELMGLLYDWDDGIESDSFSAGDMKNFAAKCFITIDGRRPNGKTMEVLLQEFCENDR